MLARRTDMDRPSSRLTVPAAVVAVILLTAVTVSVLVASRHVAGLRGTAASGSRAVPAIPTKSPNVVALSAPSSTVVWALVDDGVLYRSTDQGNDWQQDFFTGPFRSTSFLDDHEGWLLSWGPSVTQCQGAKLFMWHTTDAASGWQQSSGNGIAASQCKDGVWFVDAKHGFVTAWDPDHRPTVYGTSDGGDHWAPSTLPDPPDFRTLAGGFSLRVEWIKVFGGTLYLEA